MKRGRPPSPYKTTIHGVDQVIGRDDDENSEPMPHEIDHAMDTLQRAQEIQNNPKMMSHVHEAMGKKITSLKQLKKIAMKKRAEAASSDESM